MSSKTRTIPGHLAAPSLGEDAEFLMLLRFGNLGWIPPGGPAVFACGAERDFKREWGKWLDGPEAAHLGCRILAIRLLGEGMKAREILAVDADLDVALDADAIARSRRSGASLLALVASARHARLAERIATLRAGAGEGPPGIHLATAMAVHSTVFNLAPLAALLGYAFAEWRTSLLAFGHSPARVEAERFLAENSGIGGWAREILLSSGDSFPLASFA